MHTPIKIIFFILLSFYSLLIYADDNDTRFILDNINRQNIYDRKDINWQQLKQTNILIININGQDYRVKKNLHDLEFAIYSAINTEQWGKVKEFVQYYRQLDGHQENLVLMAEGLILRKEGKFKQAINQLEKAQILDHNNLRNQLELARIYFEDYQNKKAKNLFSQIESEQIPADTKNIVNQYLDNIQKRSQWHGSISLGTGYNNNINQSNGGKIINCEFLFFCTTTKLEDPIKSALASYNLVLSKKLQLYQNHYLLIRPILYGNYYQKHNTSEDNPIKNYTDNTSILYFGYNYLSARHDFNITPYIEHYYRDGHTNYQAFGLKSDWTYILNPKWAINGEVDIKRFHYKGEEKQYFDDFTQKSLGTTITYNITPSTQIYSGVNFTRTKYAQSYSSSKGYSVRLGAFKFFERNGIYINAMALYRNSKYDAGVFYSGDVRRHDKQYFYVMNLGFSKLAFHGIYPELRLKHTVNKSNTIIYRYKQNEVSFQLIKNF